MRADRLARLIEDKYFRDLAFAVISLIFNLFFALYNGILGVITHSAVFVLTFAYYLLLGAMRFAIATTSRKGKHQPTVCTCIGLVLVTLGVALACVLLFGYNKSNTASYGTIPMIAIATFTFTKTTMAVIKFVKQCKASTPLFKALHNIRYAEVAVSLLTMQQCMLVTFSDGEMQNATALNTFTGIAVCSLILTLGVYTLRLTKQAKK